MVVCKFFQQGNCRYGHGCRFEHIYGSKYSYRAQSSAPAESTHSNHDIFNTNRSRQGSSASSLFRSAVQNTSTYYDNSSSQNQPTRPNLSVFDRLGPQPRNVLPNNQNNQAKSIFAQANQGVFGQSTQSSNVFRTNPTSNIFQTHNESASVFHLQNQSSNIFQTQNQSNAKSLFSQASQNLFGQQQSSYIINEHKRSSISGNKETDNNSVFQILNKHSTNKFGTNVFQQNAGNDDNVYSAIEDLSKSDIERFESEDFQLGFIPELPPPKTLCDVV